MAYFARINDRAHLVESWEQVSEAYVNAIATLNLGVSETPPCRIVDEDGVTVATVSYNGRVWLGIDHCIGGGIPIYDPSH